MNCHSIGHPNEAERPFSHVIQVFIFTFFTDTVSATQNLKNVRAAYVFRAQLPMIVERMAPAALAHQLYLTSKWLSHSDHKVLCVV